MIKKESVIPYRFKNNLKSTDIQDFDVVVIVCSSVKHGIILGFNLSPDFLYAPQEIQNIVKRFLKFVNNNLEHYDYYKYENDDGYHKAIEILSGIYPILKREIGLKK